VKGVPLHAMDFWNLLNDYLSHNAITKLRDLGTFYHLNPATSPQAAQVILPCLAEGLQANRPRKRLKYRNGIIRIQYAELGKSGELKPSQLY
jgi:hypothetical protein